MFKHQYKTNFPPANKPVMVWDGDCGFCRYWMLRWKKISGNQIAYEPYQESYHKYDDIPVERFKEAVQFIETDGQIYSGPAAAYRSLHSLDKYKWLYNLYLSNRFFKKVSDHAYYFIAQRRGLFLQITSLFFGKNPLHFKPYWLIYLLAIICMVILIMMES